jgi:rubrerythrin
MAVLQAYPGKRISVRRFLHVIKNNSIESNTEPREASTLAASAEQFSSRRWLAYFEENKKSCPNIIIPETVNFSEKLKAPLIRSLQRFQIGETGEGKHLKKFAAITKDPAYERCIDMFIKEEQHHARVLAQMIAAMDGTLLTWHWSDLIFIGLRRLLHLKTEIFVLLIAEVIGKCFYRTCSAQLEDPLLSDAFSLIVLDELGHLEFHCGFLRMQFEGSSMFFRQFVLLCWSALFYSACCVFIADHKEALVALNTEPRQFFKELSTSFRICSHRALALDQKSESSG